ncbi:MAG: AbrB/MazE/SpoVT family DNA-binding domain-containing protein [Nitrosopumilaceae archaeon]|nr:AbrB/MazE/SpoVT family DNA-binding domain-containing protein [Nitrosopumilaceae archaeon]
MIISIYQEYYSINNMPKILGSSKVSPRFQITIPEEVRKVVDIEEGMTVGFVLEDDGKKISLVTEL